MKMILKFFVLGLLSLSFHCVGEEYDPLVMRAEATIFPKIILLDEELSNKTHGKEIVINILYRDGDKETAIKIKDLIEEQYSENLGNLPLKVNVTDYEKFDENKDSTAYFLLKGSADIHKKITKYAANQKKLAFSYDYKDLDSNVLISLLMKEKTYIYLNKSAVHDYGIKFLPLFYKIVKVVE